MIKVSSDVHPLTMFYFVRRYIPLLLIPVLRTAYSLLAHVPLKLILSTDIAVAAVLLFVGFVRFKRFSFSVDERHFTVRSGVVFKRCSRVPLSEISGVYVYKTPISMLFGAVRVQVDTDAGLGKNPDFVFYYSKRSAGAFAQAVTGGGESTNIKKYRCSALQTVLLSVTSASALSGLLIAATVVSNTGNLLGNRFTDYVADTISWVTVLAERIVPPVAAAAAAVLTAGFFMSFALTLVKHLTFCVSFSGDIIFVSQGIVWRKFSYIRRRSVGAVTVVQPPIMRLFRRGSLLVRAAGYGTHNGESSAIIPVVRADKSGAVYPDAGFNSAPKITLRQPRRAIVRVLFMPLLWTAAVICVPAVIGALGFTHPKYIAAACAVAVCVLLYWLSVRYFCFKRGGAALRGAVRVRGSRRMSLTDSTFFYDRIDSIVIASNPFDRGLGVCTLRAELRSEHPFSASAVSLDLSELSQELEACFGIKL